MKKLLVALALLTSPAQAWDYSKFDPGNPAASGFQMVWNDEFSSLASIDMTQTRGAGFKWYHGFFDTDPQAQSAPAPGLFTIVNDGGESFLRINSTEDNVSVLATGRAAAPGSAFSGQTFSGNPQVFNGTTYAGGWFVEYETKFNPSQVMVPYRPNNEACFPVPPREYVFVSPPLTGASWSSANGGQITFTFTSDYPVVANEGIQIYDASPSGYNGWYTVVSAGSGFAVVAKTNNPGTYTSGGYINARGGWSGGTLYSGFSDRNGCECVPGSQTQGCHGWPGIWAQSKSWVDYTYQKPGAQEWYAQYAENDILEYAYHNWYGTTRFMLMGILDWYGGYNTDMPNTSIQSLTWSGGEATITYTGSLSSTPQVGDTINLVDVYTHASFNGYLDGTTLTVTEMLGGVIVPRSDWKSQVFGGGISVASNSQPTIVEQISGTPGGAGVYRTGGNPQTVGSVGSPVTMEHRNILYDGQHEVTYSSGSTIKIAQSVNPGSFQQGKISFNPTCPAGGTNAFCRRLGNFNTRNAYAPVGTNWNNWTKVSQLWVPGDNTNGKHGFVETYINGIPVTRADWVTDVTHGGNPKPPHVLGVMDRMDMYLYLEAGAGYPIDVNYVRVWKRPQ